MGHFVESQVATGGNVSGTMPEGSPLFPTVPCVLVPLNEPSKATVTFVYPGRLGSKVPLTSSRLICLEKNASLTPPKRVASKSSAKAPSPVWKPMATATRTIAGASGTVDPGGATIAGWQRIVPPMYATEMVSGACIIVSIVVSLVSYFGCVAERTMAPVGPVESHFSFKEDMV